MGIGNFMSSHSLSAGHVPLGLGRDSMPFGLCNAPATFQRCMFSIFSNLLYDCVEIFMDEFNMYGTNFSHCLDNLSKVLDRCMEHGLVLNWKKCHFMAQEGIVLGHSVSRRGITVE